MASLFLNSFLPEHVKLNLIFKNAQANRKLRFSFFFACQIKLLELRRDVGLRFLERAYQESHVTINNLMQAVNAR